MDELRRGILQTVHAVPEEASSQPEKVMREAAQRGVTVTEFLAAQITGFVGLLLPHPEAP